MVIGMQRDSCMLILCCYIACINNLDTATKKRIIQYNFKEKVMKAILFFCILAAPCTFINTADPAAKKTQRKAKQREMQKRFADDNAKRRQQTEKDNRAAAFALHGAAKGYYIHPHRFPHASPESLQKINEHNKRNH